MAALPRYTAALQRSQHSSYAGVADRTATQLLLANIRLFDWCTPSKRRGLPLFVGALLLIFTAAWAFMAGAYPVYIAGTQDPNSPQSPKSSSSSDFVPASNALSHWFYFSATGNWDSLDDQYMLQWGALSAATVLAGQPYRWFTSLLLHKSFMQLLASVSVLLLVSFSLEYRYNTVNLALISTVAGVCANFFAAAVSSPSAIICGPVAILSCHLELLVLESILEWKARAQRKLITLRLVAAVLSGAFCGVVAILQAFQIAVLASGYCCCGALKNGVQWPLPAHHHISGVAIAQRSTGGLKANLSPELLKIATELANDEINHVTDLRSVLGSSAVPCPKMDIGGSFTSLGKAALNVDGFFPYNSDVNFLLGAFLFEDVGVTAFHGAIPQIVNKSNLETLAGISPVEAYHAAILRTLLYQKGSDMVTPYNVRVFDFVQGFSNLRGKAGNGKDQGIVVPPADGRSTAYPFANLVPQDGQGLAFSRTPYEVLAIVYGGNATTPGTFYPQGMNGYFK
ncbi:hypothetical protein WJX75_007910 [Coccomyxa subellipsoidea]|uniref:Peptidase S54 rhomboid domain-containing protein n=1 Tax=Coccomyxa subellipsoidea TaxID=248742 RepID=A0ABR2YBM9_9CHLO